MEEGVAGSLERVEGIARAVGSGRGRFGRRAPGVAACGDLMQATVKATHGLSLTIAGRRL